MSKFFVILFVCVHCVILSSALPFLIYAGLWVKPLASSFLRLYKTSGSTILGNDRSHIYVFIQSLTFGKPILSDMSAWLPTVDVGVDVGECRR